jgi:hypothetical protein
VRSIFNFQKKPTMHSRQASRLDGYVFLLSVRRRVDFSFVIPYRNFGLIANSHRGRELQGSKLWIVGAQISCRVHRIMDL